MDAVEIQPGLAIPFAELSFTTTRSGGPGGQNVNKVETRVDLRFDVASSPSLDDRQKTLIRQRLGGRIDKTGVLRVISQKHRTQAKNRSASVERFAELLAEALRVHKARRPTRVSAGARLRRVEEKRRRSERKRDRSARSDD